MSDTKRIISAKNTFFHLSAPEDNLVPDQRRSQSLPPKMRATHGALQDVADSGSSLGEDDVLVEHKDAMPSCVSVASSKTEPNLFGEIRAKPTSEQALAMQQGVLLHDNPCSTGYNPNWNAFHMGVAEGNNEVLSDDEDFLVYDLYNAKLNLFEQAPVMQQGHEVSAVLEKVQSLMMYSIPLQLTKQQVIDVINQHGFAGTYDFIHMPFSKGKCHDSRGSLKGSHHQGYAFINFLLPEVAAEFLKIFQNFCFPNCNSTKLTGSKPSASQGYCANVETLKRAVNPTRRRQRRVACQQAQ